MDIKQLQPSGAAATEGKWLEFSPPTAPEETLSVKLGYGVKAYQEELEKRFAKARRDNNGRNLTPAQQFEVRTRAKIGTLLLDWRDVQLNGADLPFSEDAAYNLLVGYPAFDVFLSENAADVRNFQDAPEPQPGSEGEAADAELKSGHLLGS